MLSRYKSSRKHHHRQEAATTHPILQRCQQITPNRHHETALFPRIPTSDLCYLDIDHRGNTTIVKKLQPLIQSFRDANKLLPTAIMKQLYFHEYPHLIYAISI